MENQDQMRKNWKIEKLLSNGDNQIMLKIPEAKIKKIKLESQMTRG